MPRDGISVLLSRGRHQSPLCLPYVNTQQEEGCSNQEKGSQQIQNFWHLVLERVTGRQARGLQMEEIGYKYQTIVYLSLKWQEETN